MTFGASEGVRPASPVDGRELALRDEAALAPDGAVYPVRDGILDLLDERFVDPALQREMDAFASMPVAGVCYFKRDYLFRAARAMARHVGTGRSPATVEIGGGEGYLARAFKHLFPDAPACVCDLSTRHLALAPTDLVRIRCDARRPYLAPGSVDIAVFWVSLHHFTSQDMSQALAQAASALRPGGLLAVFEPNADFLPRRLLYASPLKRLVYFDDEEKGVSLASLRSLTREQGLREVAAVGQHPPYDPAFLRRLRGGLLFLPAVEALRLFGHVALPDLDAPLPTQATGIGLGSYLFALYQKDGMP